MKTPLDLVKEEDEDISDLLRGDDALLECSKKGQYLSMFGWTTFFYFSKVYLKSFISNVMQCFNKYSQIISSIKSRSDWSHLWEWTSLSWRQTQLLIIIISKWYITSDWSTILYNTWVTRCCDILNDKPLRSAAQTTKDFNRGECELQGRSREEQHAPSPGRWL